MYISKENPNVKFETKEKIMAYVSELLPYFNAEDGLNVIEDLTKNVPTCYGYS